MFNSVSLKRLPGVFGSFAFKPLKPCSTSINRYPILFQAASITSKHFRDRSVKKPAPWPYKEKKFTLLHSLFGLDNTLARFDENTQVIVVEGNIAAGKTEFAKKLADELDMLYFPEPSMQSLYFDEQGIDLRTLDDKFPPSYKSCDIKRFYENPKHQNVSTFQLGMYMLRLEQYMIALAHLLNTGQGVVLERCLFSDYVFLEAMHKAGYLSAGVKSYYNEVKINTVHDIDLKPTLVIYLDADVNTLLERIRKRNISYEVNSKVLSKDYLETIEHVYKQDYLKYISKYAELLIYDWNKFGDIEAVVDDIVAIDFDKYDKYEFKLQEWRNPVAAEWDEHRIYYSNKRSQVFLNGCIPRYDVPEMLASHEEAKEMSSIINSMANFKYDKGYNPYYGDKGMLFKLRGRNYWDEQKLELYKGM